MKNEKERREEEKKEGKEEEKEKEERKKKKEKKYSCPLLSAGEQVSKTPSSAWNHVWYQTPYRLCFSLYIHTYDKF